MPPTPIDLLSETGEQEAIGGANTKSLADLAGTPASELFVLQTHQQCWVKRWVRKFRLMLAFSLGFILAVEVGGLLVVRAKLREEVRAAVTDVLKERKVIVADDQPTTTEAVAFTTQGRPR